MNRTIIICSVLVAGAAIAAGVIAAFGQQWASQWQDERTPVCIQGGQALEPGSAEEYGCKLP